MTMDNLSVSKVSTENMEEIQTCMYYKLIVFCRNPSKSCIVHNVTKRQSITKDSSAPVMREWTSQATESLALKKPLYLEQFFCTN